MAENTNFWSHPRGKLVGKWLCIKPNRWSCMFCPGGGHYFHYKVDTILIYRFSTWTLNKWFSYGFQPTSKQVVFPGADPGFSERGHHIHWKCDSKECSKRSVITAWGSGARSRAPGGVQGRSPGKGPEGRAPRSSWVFLHFNTLKRAFWDLFPLLCLAHFVFVLIILKSKPISGNFAA